MPSRVGDVGHVVDKLSQQILEELVRKSLLGKICRHFSANFDAQRAVREQ